MKCYNKRKKGGLFLRPLHELLLEDYWTVGFRFYQGEEDSVLGGQGKKAFSFLKADARYWYADPFLFEKDGRTFLFVEMFDNKTELGCIGCSEFIDGCFQKPAVVLREAFHLSYPFVFEEDGRILMMPETSGDGCIQLYECTHFPDQWQKQKVLVRRPGAVDTVLTGSCLITSVVDSAAQKTTHLEFYDYPSGRKIETETRFEPDQTSRGAGRVFLHGGEPIRPSQNGTGGEYGRGVFFNQIIRLGEDYAERRIASLTPDELETGRIKATGLHTYARNDSIEVVDIKSQRFNIRRLLWILAKKLKLTTAS